MNKGASEASAFADEFMPLAAGFAGADICLCVPFVHLQALGEKLKGTNVGLGAQNVHYEAQGAFTGEISCAMLAEAGAKYVIIGHSERRAYFHETDEIINKKMRAAIAARLYPILCVGEKLDERESGTERQVVQDQLESALAGVATEDLRRMTVAYEPVWAIGTGRAALPAQAREMCAHIRSVIGDMYGAAASGGTRCIYGGSVNPATARDIMGNGDVDGALVGGASLDPREFAEIIKAAS
jgi:triosephosphate isomerase